MSLWPKEEKGKTTTGVFYTMSSVQFARNPPRSNRYAKNMFVSRSVLRQYLAAFIGGLSIFCSGAAYTWITPLLERLESPGSVLPLTPDEGGWVVTLIEVGNLIGPLPTGILIDYFGRKWVVWLTGPIYLVTWIVILAVKSVVVLYVMRFIQGIAMSIQFTALPLYLSEIGSKEQRGALTSFFQGMWYLGIFCEYLAGKYLDYDGLTWFSLVPTAVFMLIFLFCPESPHYLAMKGKEDQAIKALCWLRDSNKDDQKIKDEIKEITVAIEEEKALKGSWRDLFGTREGRKAFYIVQLVGVVEIMSGLLTILVYCSQTFARASGDPALADTITLAMGGVLFLVNVVEVFLVERCGRRPLLLYSSFGGTFCLVLTTIYYILEDITAIDMAPYRWILYISVSGVTCWISLGAGALLPVVMAEYFPNSTRGIASGITIFNITVMSTVTLKLYQVIADNVGLYLIYLIFTAFAFFGSVGIYFFVPETKGLTFDQIQKLL